MQKCQKRKGIPLTFEYLTCCYATPIEELKPFGFCKDCWETNGKPKAMKGEENEEENKTMRM